MGTKRKLDSESRDISPPPTAKKQTTTTTTATTATTTKSTKSTGLITPHPRFYDDTDWEAISSFFTPLSQKKTSSTTIEWSIIDKTLLMGKYRPKNYLSPPPKIAAFDLDGTLIKTKSGVRFANDASDWTWLYSKVPTKLKELHAQGSTPVKTVLTKDTESWCLVIRVGSRLNQRQNSSHSGNRNYKPSPRLYPPPFSRLG
jgi:bifunctional polynucleotide phosphatase/kinase